MSFPIRAPGPDDPRVRWALRQYDVLQRRLEVLEVQLISAAGKPGSVGVRRRIVGLLERAGKLAERWTDEALPVLMSTGVNYAAGLLRTQAVMTGLTRNALAVLQADTLDDLMRATRSVQDDLKRFSRSIIREITKLQVQDGIGVPEAKRLVAGKLDEIGLRFTDVGGRRWKLDTYSEMVVRTKSAQTFNAGTILHSRENGVELFEVFDGTVHDDVCAAANGQTWTAAQCMSDPVAHPNCRRAFGPLPFGQQPGRSGGALERDRLSRID